MGTHSINNLKRRKKWKEIRKFLEDVEINATGDKKKTNEKRLEESLLRTLKENFQTKNFIIAPQISLGQRVADIVCGDSCAIELKVIGNKTNVKDLLADGFNQIRHYQQEMRFCILFVWDKRDNPEDILHHVLPADRKMKQVKMIYSK